MSGGIDSSAIAAFANSSVESSQLKSFNAAFPGAGTVDEGRVAEATASLIGTEHHKIEVDSSIFFEKIKETIKIIEEPCSAPVSVPILLLAEEAKKNRLKVILSGEGADELFVGYAKWNTLKSLKVFFDLMPTKLLSNFLKLERFFSLTKYIGILHSYSKL